MLYFYLFAAVAGSLLVGVSVASGGGNDGDAGGGGDSSDAHALTDGSGHAQAPEQALTTSSGPGHMNLSHSHHGSGLGAAALQLLSLQLWTYLLAFGGLTGLLLRTLGHVGEPMAGLCALSVGLGTALTARKVLRGLAREVDSGTVDAERLLGATAEVLVPADAGKTGKVRLSVRGQTVDLLARASDGSALTAGAEVVILEVKDGVAEVTTEVPELSAKPALPSSQQAARAALAAPISSPKGNDQQKG